MGQIDLEVVAAASKLLVARLKAEARGKVDDIESLLRQTIREIGRTTEEALLAIRSREVTELVQAEGYTVQHRDRVQFEGLYGRMEVESPYLWDQRNKVGRRPVKTELGVKARGRSTAVIRALTDFGAEESFEHASQRFFEHYGWSIGRTSVLRIVENVAKEAGEFVKQELEKARAGFEQAPLKDGAQPILVELDGCEIRTGSLVPAPELGKTEVRQQDKRRRETAWRDVRMGLSRRLDDVERTYVGRLDSHEAVVSDLFSAACKRGLSPQTLTVACTDGGNGIREEIEAQFPRVQYVLDRAHAKSHVYETADAMGLKDPVREQWVGLQMARLDEGKVEQTLNELDAHRGRGRMRAQRLHSYLTRFKDAVHYAKYRQAGFPIGSGEIESAHRAIPQKRLKLPGAWWNEKTVNPMLALRLLRANGWWSDFWHQRKTA
jgi:hypothetical protein